MSEEQTKISDFGEHKQPVLAAIEKYKQKISEGPVVLDFRGAISQDLLVKMEEQIKGKFNRQFNIGRKIFAVFIEMAQNIAHYSAERVTAQNDQPDVGAGVIAVEEKSGHYTVTSGNLVANSAVPDITGRCAVINRMGKDQLKQFYKEQIKASRKKGKRGADVGLIDIVRKSGNPIIYRVNAVDDNNSFLILSAKIQAQPGGEQEKGEQEKGEQAMENLHIPKTKYTLEINCDKTTGVLDMEGSSYPENALDFFGPIIEWIKQYIRQVSKQLIVNIRLNYLNTSSTKCLLDIFEILEQYSQAGGNVTLNWYYAEDDEDIKETGEELGEDFDFPIEFISY